MQVVPSTYHQCLKFSFQGYEITIRGDAQPFEYCHVLEASSPYLHNCSSINSGAAPTIATSSSYVDPNTILNTIKEKTIVSSTFS